MCAIAARLGVSVLILSADLDGVVALDHREVLLPIIGSIWPSDDRVSLDTAHEPIGGVSE